MNDNATPISSVDVSVALIFSSTLSADEKLVLIAIANRMYQGKASCFPSQALLVSETSLSLSSVKRAIASMSKSGWLKVASEGKGKGNVYTIVPQASMLRAYDEVHASARQSSVDSVKRMDAWRESKGIAPTMPHGAVEILAALVELPALAAIANDNDAAALASIADETTGEVVEPATAVRALKKLGTSGKVAGKSGVRNQAATWIRNEGPAAVEAAPPSTVRSRVAPKVVPVGAVRYSTAEWKSEPALTAEERAKSEAARIAAIESMSTIGRLGFDAAAPRPRMAAQSPAAAMVH
jgi:hypothetical protein